MALKISWITKRDEGRVSLWEHRVQPAKCFPQPSGRGMNAPEAPPSSLEDFVLEATSLGVPVRAGSAQGPLKALGS